MMKVKLLKLWLSGIAIGLLAAIILVGLIAMFIVQSIRLLVYLCVATTLLVYYAIKSQEEYDELAKELEEEADELRRKVAIWRSLYYAKQEENEGGVVRFKRPLTDEEIKTLYESHDDPR